MTEPLSIEPGAAETCADAWREYGDKLRDLKYQASRFVRLDAFGTLPSGQLLGNKFLQLAVGSDRSFASVIQQHIDIADRMHETFLAAGRAYAETEAQNAERLTNSE
ncbi:hypothetical protein GCM10007304_12250 [Rhodococcoides trifolii]|uniref:Uncharacterized protein n=1 Tax=Rhodococcoides trifolii TaxID=908250 RepID=A0A917FTD7_9NOCA|nr:hypothetical protein [Rhodococcus trifolii]GGF99892.1 hypothetical protein GCM10007304_12250 [Rhodococcus trifolii]